MQQTLQINTLECDKLHFAAEIVNRAYSYSSTIQIEAGDKKVSAKSLVGLFSLMLGSGESITLYADGPDAIDATNDIGSYLCN